ncbi:hypothetical protein HKD32_03165 [Gluconobacter japonicus]|uniref:Uncharacterized protein n=2 Tax=Gluconobacter japonicus TaxID=376620 RepID=A0A9Q2FID5_GLUJA|nr:hypothetical protein [Gluconobacter japonicus]
MMPHSPTRRDCLKGLALLGAGSAIPLAGAQAADISDARLLLGGTLASIQGQFAELAAGVISHTLGLDAPLEITPDIGQDGVRAANLFDANTAPDGSTALIAPGSVLLASLTGDSRVHYDFTRWTPLLTAHTTTVVIARAELHKTLKSRLKGFFHDHPVRLAVSRPTGTELDALLGLTLLGLRPIPVSGFVRTEDALDALANNQVDAVQLLPYTLGVPVEDILAKLPPDTVPLYHTGDLAETSANSIPNFLEAYQQARRRPPEGALYRAWQAVSASTYTALTVALPMLTPPDLVKSWQKACWDAAVDPTVHRWAEKHHFMLAAGDNAAPFLSRATPDIGAILALRRWIAMNTPRWRLGQETRPI